MAIGSIVFSVFVVVAVVIALRYTVASDYTSDDNLEYAPRDTRVIPFVSTFCQTMSLSYQLYTYGYNPSLYLLSSPPKLTAHDTFSYSKDLTMNYVDDFDYNYYYLYPGSGINISACLSDDSYSTVYFYIIKGHKNFKSWKKYESSRYSWKKVFISDKCSSARNKTYSYDIKSEDHYFLAFDYPTTGVVKMKASFNRTGYSFSNESVVDSCTLQDYGTPCSVGIPLSGSGKRVLLTVQPAPDYVINWSDDEISLDTNCSPRIWTYVVISVSGVVGLLAIVTVLVCCICICIRKKQKSHASNTTAEINPAAETVSAPLLANQPPPPTNPDYHQIGGYGTGNYEAPPKYNS